MAKNDFQYGGWNSYTLRPNMWHVARLGYWQWIHQVTVGLSRNVTRGSGMTCHWIRPNIRHIGILLLVSISTISPQSTCHTETVCEILSESDHPRQTKMTSSRFSRWRISAILDFRGPIMGSFKSPCTTSYIVKRHHSSKLLSFSENRVVVFWRQTDRRTDGQTRCMKPLSLSRAAA